MSVARDAVRTQLWPLPTVGVVLAAVLGVVLPKVDSHLDPGLPRWAGDYLFGGGSDAARSVLAAIAGSMITVTSLTFSLTVVTLQLASSQFSPRLLRTFAQDVFVQGTLALFLATFTYAVAVLRTVRTAVNGRSVVVPQLSVTVALVLTVASVLGLVIFLAHLARQIRVETMLRTVHSDGTATINRMLSPAPSAPGDVVRAVPPDASAISAPASGFLTRIDEQALLRAACEAEATVLLDRYPGSSVIAGTPIAFSWPSNRQRGLPAPTRERLTRRTQEAVRTGFERTAAQDTSYALRQLTDVAIKALSPGINDPTTAVHALSHSSALLCELVDHYLGPRVLRDENDVVRVILRRPDLADLLELALEQPRRYGSADPLVVARLFMLLREVAWRTPPAHRSAIAEQLRRLRASVQVHDFDDTERDRLTDLDQRVEDALTGIWTADHGA